MTRWRFRLGDAFPHDSILALWLGSLAMATNDLVLSNVKMSEAFRRDADSPSAEGIDFVRLAASHFREAVKVLGEVERHEELRVFIEDLPAEALTDYRALREASTPWKGSFVEQVAYPIRNRFMHYPALDTDRSSLSQSLTELADTESGITRRGE